MRRSLRPLLAAVVLVAALAVPVAAHGHKGPVIYASNGFGSQLIKIDVATGHVTAMGSFGAFSLGLAFSPRGRLFTVTDSFSAGCSPCVPQLARVNPSTGQATPFGVPGEPFMGVGFSPDGTLYGVNAMSGSPDAGSLYRFDTTTGAATKVGVTGGCFEIMDLAWGPDGTMYGAAWNSLYRINPHTGKAKLITTITGLSANAAVMGLAIDDDGNFYVSEIVPDAHLFRVNPKTGAATQIVLDARLDNVHGLDIQSRDHER